MTIGVLYYIPKNSKKYSNWHDGFTAAMHLVAKKFEVLWLNYHDYENADELLLEQINRSDFLIVKSNLGWVLDKFVYKNMRRIKPVKSIMISGSRRPSFFRSELRKYDVVYFETFWYAKYLSRHKRIIHAFGIDTTKMFEDQSIEKKYDWISVGALVDYKSHENMLNKHGRRLVIGYDPKTEYSASLREKLEADGIEVLPFGSHDELRLLYQASRNLLVACELNGGGERAILEARACGCEVHLESKNPKLEELLTSPIYSHEYYAEQLLKGVGVD